MGTETEEIGSSIYVVVGVVVVVAVVVGAAAVVVVTAALVVGVLDVNVGDSVSKSRSCATSTGFVHKAVGSSMFYMGPIYVQDVTELIEEKGLSKLLIEKTQRIGKNTCL
jgi:hypothetical protein